LKKDFEMQEIVKLLAQTEGVQVYDNPAENKYPMPVTAYDENAVFVGRIRRDNSYPQSLNMWIVADNIRKGAATNAVQIAHYLLQKELVN
jgi:aspartate-semialdehyde dehydrogenase